MIDFELVTKSTEYSLNKLDSMSTTECPSLFLLDDFLHPELLEKLYSFIIKYPEDKWIKEVNQENQNRLKINWVPDSVIEETHMVMENLTTKVNEIFEKSDTFVGITIWKDAYGYSIRKHVDIPFIDISLQLYLNSNSDRNYATEFEYNGKSFEAKYAQNSGYLLGSSVLHSMSKTVAKGDTRFSLYAIWRQ